MYMLGHLGRDPDHPEGFSHPLKALFPAFTFFLSKFFDLGCGVDTKDILTA
jgi:hypothetical protein